VFHHRACAACWAKSQCNKSTMKDWVDFTRQPKRLLRPDYDILHWAIDGGGKPLSYALEVKHQGTTQNYWVAVSMASE
jgi:hypothetical protein